MLRAAMPLGDNEEGTSSLKRSKTRSAHGGGLAVQVNVRGDVTKSCPGSSGGTPRIYIAVTNRKNKGLPHGDCSSPKKLALLSCNAKPIASLGPLFDKAQH